MDGMKIVVTEMPNYDFDCLFWGRGECRVDGCDCHHNSDYPCTKLAVLPKPAEGEPAYTEMTDDGGRRYKVQTGCWVEE